MRTDAFQESGLLTAYGLLLTDDQKEWLCLVASNIEATPIICCVCVRVIFMQFMAIKISIEGTLIRIIVKYTIE